MTEIERLNAELHVPGFLFQAILCWLDAEAPIRDALIRDTNEYLEGTENE